MRTPVWLALSGVVAMIPLIFLGTRAVRLSRRRVPSSLVVFVPVAFLEYPLRALYLAGRESIGWDDTSLRDIEAWSSGVQLYAIFLPVALVCVVLGYIRPQGLPAPRTSGFDRRYRLPGWLLPTTLCFGALSLYLAAGLASGQSVASGEFGRSQFGSGYSYLLLNIVAVLVLVVFGIERLSAGELTRKGALLAYSALALFVVAHLFFTGGRHEVVAALLGVLVLRVVGVTRFRPGRLALAGLILVGALSSYRIATRETLYADNSDKHVGALLADSISDPIGSLMRGDVSGTDKLILTLERDDIRLSGGTYLAALQAPVPGTSTVDGGNRAFTKIFDRERYDRARTYEGASYFGEAVLNFGVPGLLMAGYVLGSWLRFLDRLARSGQLVGIVLWALMCGGLPTLLRADALNFAASYGPLALLCMGVSSRIHRYTETSPLGMGRIVQSPFIESRSAPSLSSPPN